MWLFDVYTDVAPVQRQIKATPADGGQSEGEGEDEVEDLSAPQKKRLQVMQRKGRQTNKELFSVDTFKRSSTKVITILRVIGRGGLGKKMIDVNCTCIFSLHTLDIKLMMKCRGRGNQTARNMCVWHAVEVKWLSGCLFT